MLPVDTTQQSHNSIMSIINNDLFDTDLLNKYKSEIINYINEKNIDIVKLLTMTRKDFINEVTTHLNNKTVTTYFDNNELKTSLGELYDAIIQYHTSNNPIIWIIIDDLFDTLKETSAHLLNKYKSEIINYINEKKIDIVKLLRMTRKDFINEVTTHLNNNDNNELMASLGELYDAIIQYHTSISYHTAFLGGECEIIEIDTKNQTFLVEMYINILWRDDIKYQEINEQNEEDIKLLQDKLAQPNINPQYRYPGYFVKIKGEEKKLIKNKIPLYGSLPYMFKNTSEIESVNAKKEISRILYRPQDKLFIQYLHFKGLFHEDFEFKWFPFDKQFLNIKINYNNENFKFTNDFNTIERDKKFDVGFAIKRMKEQKVRVKLGESVTEYNVKDPWLDLNNKKHKFCVVKLRVVRKSNFYIFSNLMPLFIIIFCTFGIIAMYDKDLSIDVKLSYVAAFLLTVTALQFSVTQNLPNKSELSIMDLSFLVAYCILG
eukprot:366657_1